MRITTRGILFAREVRDHFAPSDLRDLEAQCSALVRLAPAYQRIQEHACNGTLTAAHAKREAQIVARVQAIVGAFPAPIRGARASVVFTGDPRGPCMRVKVGGVEGGNTWGRDGEYGVML